MKLEQIAVLMGRQRSGTHMLGAMIGSHPAVKYTGEIFWGEKRARDWPDMVGKIDRVSGGGVKFVLIDVKYNQISDPLRLLIPQVKVIQIVRRDVQRLFYSGELHTLYGRNPDAKARGICPEFTVGAARLRAFEKDYLKQVATYTPWAGLTLYYEDLTDNQETAVMPEEYSRAVCDYLEIGHLELTTGTKKNAPPDISGRLIITRGMR